MSKPQISRRLQRQLGWECLLAARGAAVMPRASASMIAAGLDASAAIEQARAAAAPAAGGSWHEGFDRAGRPCRMFVPSKA